MVEDDVMILDSGFEIYVWIGEDAMAEERKQAIKLAKVLHSMVLKHSFFYSSVKYML